MLMEFKYDNIVDETFSTTQEVPRKAFYWLKKELIPFSYWNFMPSGRWYGNKMFFAPRYNE